MSKRTVTTDELRAMMHSPKTLPAPETLEYEGCWYPVVEEYRTEYAARQITRLRRERSLLRAALEESISTVRKSNAFSGMMWSSRWEERILKLTEEK